MNKGNKSDAFVSSFFNNVQHIPVSRTKNEFPFCIDNFAELSAEAVYVIDFAKRNFFYVGNHDLFLCGNSKDEVLSMGYDHYKMAIHKDDLPVLIDIHKAILRRLRTIKAAEEINYFSFNIGIKNENEYIMAYHKLKPIFVAGKIRYGVCMLSCTSDTKPGNLRAYLKNNNDYEEYMQESELWQKRKIVKLSSREKKILKLAIQGKKGVIIADSVGLTHQALRSALSSIYKKLNVRSLIQVVTLALNHRIIYH